MSIFSGKELRIMKEVLKPNQKLVKGTPYCVGELRYIFLKLWGQIISNREIRVRDSSEESNKIWKVIHKLNELQDGQKI